MKNILFYYLCGLIIYAPIPLGANRIWASSSIVFLVFLGFLAHLIRAAKNNESPLPPKFSRVILVPLALTASWLAIQIIPGLGTLLGRTEISTLSFDPSLTEITLLKTLAFTLFSWLLFYYVDSRRRLYHLALTIVLTGLIQASYAAWLNLNVGMETPIFNMPFKARANGSFIYHNQLANYLAQCLAIGIGVLVSQLSRKGSEARLKNKLRDFGLLILSPKMVLRLSLIIMVIALILTRSRMGNSAFFFALAIVSLFAFFFYNRKPQNLRLLILSFFVIDLIIVGSIFGVEKVQQRIAETSLASETRDEVVRDSIPIIQEFWLTGTGGGSFYSTFIGYHPEVYTGFYDHAHNDYIQFAVEFGVPVTLMLGIMLLMSLYISLKTLRKRRSPLYQGIAFGSAIAVTHMLLHSTVDFSLQSPAVALLFISVLTAGILAANLPSSRKS